MGPGLFIAAIVVAAALFAYLAWLAAKRRREALALVARSMGWQYAADDPFDCTNLAFALFFRGDDQGARNVLWGTTHDGQKGSCAGCATHSGSRTTRPNRRSSTVAGRWAATTPASRARSSTLG